MEYKLLLVYIFMFVGLSVQGDDRMTALKDSMRRLAQRAGGKAKLDGEYVGPFGGKFKASLHAESSVNGNRGRFQLRGEYSGPLGEARGRIRSDRLKGLGLKARRLDVEGGYRGLFGGGAEGHFLTDARNGVGRFGGVEMRRQLDTGFAVRRPSGAGVGARSKIDAGMRAGLSGIEGEVRGGAEGGIRGAFGVGANGGFDGGFRGSVGLPVLTGGYVIGGVRV